MFNNKLRDTRIQWIEEDKTRLKKDINELKNHIDILNTEIVLFKESLVRINKRVVLLETLKSHSKEEKEELELEPTFGNYRDE